MEETEQSSRPESVSVYEARRRLFERVIAAISADDPAPWFVVPPDQIEMFARGDAAQYVRECKLSYLVSRILTRALVSGELQAHVSDGRDAFDLPQWVWADAWNEEGTRFAYRLNVGPLAPDEWQRWSNERAYMDCRSFDAWLASLTITAGSKPEPMPLPNDAENRPAPIRYREPPQTPYITLSEAVSWAAFGISLDWNRLGSAFDTDELGDGARDKLRGAVAKLAALGSGSEIALLGKYVEHNGIDHRNVNSDPIPTARLLDFQRLNVVDDRLAFGKGLVWLDGPEPLSSIFSDRRDEYRCVVVKRTDLMSHYPSRQQSVAEPLMAPSPPSDETVLGRKERLFWAPFWSTDKAKNAEFEAAGRTGSFFHARALVENAEAEIDAFAKRLVEEGHSAVEASEIASRLFNAFAEQKRLVARVESQEFRRLLDEALVRAAGEMAQAVRAAAAVAVGLPAPTRAPSFKTGHPPSDDAIRAKADEMRARGMHGYRIASEMRHEPGFSEVATTVVRELIRGRWKGGRPRAKRA